MARGPIPNKPRDRPTVPDVLPLVRAYMDMTDDMGGSLHIVLSDGNLEDGHIARCAEEARDQGDAAGERIARLLLQMTRTQRYRVYEGRR